MSKDYIHKIPDDDPHFYKTNWRTFCMPKKIDCNIDNDDIVTDCDKLCDCDCEDQYNAKIPYQDGDTFMIQLHLFDDVNIDRKVPLIGFGTWIIPKICDKNGNDLGILIDAITVRKFVAWSGTSSYQQIEFKFQNTPDCFSIKFEIYKDGLLQKTLCSRIFEREIKEKTCVLMSKRTGYDCRGNYYGEAVKSFGDQPFKFNNTIRAYCNFKKGSPEITETKTGNKVSKIETKYIEYIEFNVIPSFMLKYLNDVIFFGDVYFDGVKLRYEHGEADKIEGICNFNMTKKIIKYCESKKC